jgi:hypothetical protein
VFGTLLTHLQFLADGLPPKSARARLASKAFWLYSRVLEPPGIRCQYTIWHKLWLDRDGPMLKPGCASSWAAAPAPRGGYAYNLPLGLHRMGALGATVSMENLSRSHCIGRSANDPQGVRPLTAMKCRRAWSRRCRSRPGVVPEGDDLSSAAGYDTTSVVGNYAIRNPDGGGGAEFWTSSPKKLPIIWERSIRAWVTAAEPCALIRYLTARLRSR